MKIYRVAVGLVVVELFAAMVVAAAAFAGGGNSANAKACQKNGWESLYRSDGTSFRNQGDCVSYGAQGGILRTSVADVSLSAGVAFGGGVIGLVFCATNAGPSAATITVQGEAVKVIDGIDDPGSATQTLTLLPGQRTRLSEDFHFVGIELGTRAYAQVTASSAYDPDSTPNNYAGGLSGPVVEDDEAFVEPTVDTVGGDC